MPMERSTLSIPSQCCDKAMGSRVAIRPGYEGLSPSHDESSTSITMNVVKVDPLAMYPSHANDLRQTMVQTTSRH